jgi:hypothetical protein
MHDLQKNKSLTDAGIEPPHQNSGRLEILQKGSGCTIGLVRRERAPWKNKEKPMER